MPRRFRTLAEQLDPLAPELETEDEPAGDSPRANGKRAAVAVALRPVGAELEALLMRRVEHEADPWSGQVSLPGGHAEEDDADLVATAVRETREELTVDLASAARCIGRLPAIQARASGRLLETWIHPFVFALETDVEPLPGPEASEAFWLPLMRVAAGGLDDVYHYGSPGVVRELPCWRFEERIVWGLTHRILGELLQRMPT